MGAEEQAAVYGLRRNRDLRTWRVEYEDGLSIARGLRA
ncbi:MAG: hypothetical protein BSOLF_2094 [Candidatus Carbobacillus altaicus]|uniref:Uncharacterized protein n=1 Tax=Candidatus Carbonibacillus altaicus TaxID=2163959 RepID=A0A2R6XYH9_9BACL|nr:MAG: hypothetical protein BSOLF_2094 [Candidatus Carbobacillus altaicus]